MGVPKLTIPVPLTVNGWDGISTLDLSFTWHLNKKLLQFVDYNWLQFKYMNMLQPLQPYTLNYKVHKKKKSSLQQRQCSVIEASQAVPSLYNNAYDFHRSMESGSSVCLYYSRYNYCYCFFSHSWAKQYIWQGVKNSLFQRSTQTSKSTTPCLHL